MSPLDPQSVGASPSPLEELADRIEEQRERSRNFFAERQNRWNELEQRLLSELRAIVERLDEWEQFHDHVERRHGDLAQKRQELQEESRELASQAQDLAQRQAKTKETRRRIARKLEQRRTGVAAQQSEQATRLQGQVDQLETELDKLRLTTEDLSAERDSLGSQLEQQTAQRNRIENDYRAARDALLASRNDEKDLRRQVAQSRKLLNERAQQLTQLREQLEEAIRRSEEDDEQSAAIDPQALIRLQEERDRLHEQVTQLQSQLAVQADAAADHSDYEDLRRQFEMAVESVRALKERNEELESELQKGTASIAQENTGSFDWEMQKSRMLNGLSAEDDVPSEERNTIEKTIQVTSGIVEEKDKELAALRAQIDRLTGTSGQGATAPDASLDADEKIREERERLRKLQEEWREKLRAAEVEMAVKRAENARARAAMEEKVRDVERQANMLAKIEGKSGTGRRWMDHLGLSDRNKSRDRDQPKD